MHDCRHPPPSPPAARHDPGLLITQYKSAIDTLYLSQQSVGEALDPTAQPPAQDVTSMNNFSSTDEVTFWPWRVEALAILRHSGMAQEHWAEALLQHVFPPALNKVTPASKGDIDSIFNDLQYHYGDPHVTTSTLPDAI